MAERDGLRLLTKDELRILGELTDAAQKVWGSQRSRAVQDYRSAVAPYTLARLLAQVERLQKENATLRVMMKFTTKCSDVALEQALEFTRRGEEHNVRQNSGS